MPTHTFVLMPVFGVLSGQENFPAPAHVVGIPEVTMHILFIIGHSRMEIDFARELPPCLGNRDIYELAPSGLFCVTSISIDFICS